MMLTIHSTICKKYFKKLLFGVFVVIAIVTAIVHFEAIEFIKYEEVILNSNILLAVGKSSRGIRAARLPSRDSQRSRL